MSPLRSVAVALLALLVSGSSWGQPPGPENLFGLRAVNVYVYAPDNIEDSVGVSTQSLQTLVQERLVENGVPLGDPSDPLGTGTLVVAIVLLQIDEPERAVVMIQVSLLESVVPYRAMARMFYSEVLPKTQDDMVEVLDYAPTASMWSDSMLGVLLPGDQENAVRNGVSEMVDSFSADFREANSP